MRMFLISLLCLLASNVEAQFSNPIPNTSTDGKYALAGAMILGTGSYLLDGSFHTVTWRNSIANNPSGKNLKIKKVTIWTGVDYAAKADVGVILLRESDGTLMQFQGWDHYADPTAPNHESVQDYGNNFIRLGLGDALSFSYWGSGFTGGLHANHILMIWAEYE